MSLHDAPRRDWDSFSNDPDFRFNIPPLPRVTVFPVRLNKALWPALPCGCAVDQCGCEQEEAR
jgi:hypothetical protein